MTTDLASAFAERSLDVDFVVRAIDLRAGEVAYVTGSVADGLGGAQADLDIYVITDRRGFEDRQHLYDTERRVQQRRHDFGIAYLNVGGVELDVEFHPRDKFEQLFVALDQLRPVTRRKLWESFRSLGAYERPYALELLHRLRRSWPLGNAEAYVKLRNQFDDRTFLDWNALFALMECEDYEKGTRRSLQEMDPESACLKLRHFYDSLVDATLFSQGDSLDRWKWRLPKLRRLGDKDLLAEYLSVQFSPSNHDSALLAAKIHETLAQGCARHAALIARFE